jgi:penicillin amidase
VFREVFLEEILRDQLGEEWKAYHWFNSSTLVENLLKTRNPIFLPKTHSSYDVFILNCLLQAADRLTSRYRTTEPNRWQWGEYLPVEFKHPLGQFWPLTRLLNTGPAPQPGTPLTIKQTSSRVGVSMRMVVDFSDLDQSLNNVTLGQSGQVFSSHYRDHFPHWLQAKSYPMLFTTTQIRNEAVATLRLEPE